MMGEVLGDAKRQSRAIATLGVIEVKEFNDDTKSGDTSGKTFVDNFYNCDNFSSNFDNFDNFSSNFGNFK